MAGYKNKYELAGLVWAFGNELIKQNKLSPQQTKALYNIMRCRTASLGGHEEACDCCGEIRYSYNSCGDRHCPRCQNTKQAIWVEELIKSTLGVKHYHIIFTVPHCLNDVCLWNDRVYYNILFSAVWRTLHSFGYTHYGVETGAVAVLHSWGENLSLHPHIHCIVPAAGYSLKGEWKNIGKYQDYLYPANQLSDTFKGKFLDSLKRWLRKNQTPRAFDRQIQKAYEKRWIINCQASMAGAEHVIGYLGQYTHRVAISNKRIKDVSGGKVTFTAKDYRERVTKKPVTLDGVEFLRRFCQHIMPKRFVRIRRYGIYNPTVIRNHELKFNEEKKPGIEELKKQKDKETPAERIKRLTGFDIGLCPVCKKGRMHVIGKIPRIRSPAGHLPSLLSALLK